MSALVCDDPETCADEPLHEAIDLPEYDTSWIALYRWNERERGVRKSCDKGEISNKIGNGFCRRTFEAVLWDCLSELGNSDSGHYCGSIVFLPIFSTMLPPLNSTSSNKVSF